jgi:U3 small nucleolar RNA-associated protein 6
MSDFAMVRRIHFIFERAVRKFKTDLGLWTAWLEFCRNSNSNRRLGRVVARALHIHPTGVLVMGLVTCFSSSLLQMLGHCDVDT